MPTFSYTAIDSASGRERAGTIEGDTEDEAVATLKARGLAPTSILRAHAAVPKPVAIGAGKGLAARRPSGSMAAHAARRSVRRRFVIGRVATQKEIAIFTRQLATLIKAGMPLLRSLEVLGRQEKNPEFSNAIDEIAASVRSGGNFSEGLSRHPKLFDRLYLNMVKAGEAGGMLDAVLERLARFMEQRAKIQSKVQSAMTYPVIVIVLSLGIVAAMMVFVVPRFEQIFTGLLKGQPLPALTQLVMSVSYFIKNHAVAAVALIAGAGFGTAMLARTTRGRRLIDWLAIRLPLVGDLFLKAAIARFTRTFGTLLASGVPILQALTITRDTTSNVHLAEALAVVHDRVKEGQTVAAPLEATQVFPGMVTSMIEVGEETGALPEMLVRIADGYDEEVDVAVAGLTSLIEPLMIVLLAVLVGGIVIALFLPIVSIIQHLQ